MTGDENKIRSLLILYDYFYPGYKAGGPIQSLNNLIATLGKQYSVSVITSAFDLHSAKSYADIRVNKWNTVILPGCSWPITVWYGRKKSPTIKKLKQLIYRVKPEFIYITGIFSYRFCMVPLMAVNRLNYTAKIIICPRGMLQQEALSGKSLKKNLYLKLLSFSGLLKSVSWHATSREEKEDIKKVFGEKQPVEIAGNIPRKPLAITNYPIKQKGGLRLVYLSLIAEKKNLLMGLEIIKKCDGVTLDIYGPVKDVAYWKECKQIIDQSHGKLKYKGEIIPEKVQETFEQYDASILLTKGENFGHALYESLSVGRPVITSHFTPWNNLQQQKAGWNIDISSMDEAVSLLKYLCNMSSNEFNEYADGAHELAVNYYSGLNSVDDYTKLFS